MTIQERQTQLDELCRQAFGEDDAPGNAGVIPVRAASLSDDDELLVKAYRAKNGETLRDLLAGNWQGLGYPSQSEADFSAMSRLAFWTGRDVERMVRIFRRSGLMREKAERDDYVYNMARKAAAGTSDVYGARPSGLLAAGASSDRPPWPVPLDEAAFHGPVGVAVRLIEPHSEADPAGLIFTFLDFLGAEFGNGPHMLVEADKHPARLDVVLVGSSSKARKGTGKAQVMRIMLLVDPTFRDRTVNGLSTGEGLIAAVHDPVMETRLDKKTGTYETVVEDPGVSDKRLLVAESEFGRVLNVMKRPADTLSAVLRCAWDGDVLRTLTRNSPLTATGANICLLGHITREELMAGLTSTEAVNGFGNRILWVCVRRSKKLAHGGQLDPADLRPVVERLKAAADFAQSVDRLNWSPAAGELWTEAYDALSAEADGLFGAVTARAEAHVLRLSLTYALLDCSRLIEPEHLRAGLALWRYAEDSAAHIFGRRLGRILADDLLEKLRGRPDGMTRTEIRNAFARHKSGSAIEDALGALSERGLAVMEKRPTAGAPSEVWRATEAT